ncbi:uncharacterized protein [Porites lutea]|uniref:uncharacterized protein isoform X2 n=1 Tax=Porites lutea TaxID=51062 RepID=UPI003CC616D5
MFPLVIYRILCVACWLCAGLQLCCAIDKLKEEQTARINCTRTCAHLTKDLVRTQLSYEIWTQQACYKECLRKLGAQDKFEIYEKSHIFKRIKRESPDVPDSKQGTCRSWTEKDHCRNISERNYLGIPQENINIAVHRLGTTGRFYVNISWIPPPESVSWKGYKLVYAKGYDYEYYCCRDLNKTSTYAIADNSSEGLLGGGEVYVKVFARPLVVSTGKPLDFKFELIPGNDESTEPESTEITSLSTDPATTEITSTSAGTNKNHIIAVAIVVPILALLALLAYWYFCHPCDQSSKTGVSDTEFQFDAFIIYSSADEEWVKKTLLPILEEKNALKCCIHYRDFIPGKPFRDNMADSVYTSRKTIAVVSHNFFKSQYCHHEMDMALGRLVKTGDNSVIVIKLDDVDGKKLPKALKERSYIDYYKLNDKETWEKQLIHCLKVSVQHRLITQNSFVYSEIGGVCV